MDHAEAGDATELNGAVERVSRLCSDFRLSQTLRRTEKSLLLAGTVRNDGVVAKVLLDHTPFWREKFLQEIATYRYLREQSLPFNVPRLVEADEASPVLLIRHVSGHALSS